MIVFVLLSMVMGAVASVFALLSGSSFLIAILIYSATGVLTITAVLVRAFICLKIRNLLTELEARKGASRVAY